MAACAECGKESMSFTCSYCGKSFCSDHRLPENHSCQKLEEELERKKQEDDKWFEEKKSEKETTTKRRRPPKKPSLAEDILNVFRNNITYSIIAVTVFFYLLQPFLPGISPPISSSQFQAIISNPMELSPLILYPSIDYIVQRPWTILTVMLMHGGVLHIFANMVTFYFFGRPVENIIGAKDTLKLYLVSGLVSSLAIIGFQNIQALLYPSFNMSPIVGASGAVVAFIGAVAMLYPDAEVLLYFVVPMKIKTAVYAFAGIEIFNIIMKLFGIYLPLIGGFASSAHLAGLIIGLWYGRKIRDKAGRMGVFDPLGY